MRLKNRIESKKRLSVTLSGLSFILKAKAAPEGLYTSVCCSRGKLTAYFHSTLQKGKAGPQHFHPLSSKERD